MRNRLALVLAAAVTLTVASSPAQAQRARGTHRGGAAQQPSVRPPAPNRSVGVVDHVFLPGFGLRPVIQERFPVFGQGFDAHHFNVINRGGFFGGGFFGKRFFAGGFFPFFGSTSTSTVVVVPQAIPVQVPVVVQSVVPMAGEIVVPVGLPDNWRQLRIVKPSYAEERPPVAQLTLLVLKDESIFAVSDYWLEDGIIFYVTSTGRQGSVAVRDLDWEMTTRLNAERHVTFVLRSGR